MTVEQWLTFGGFAGLLIGLSIFNPGLAAIVGLGVTAVILLQHPQLFGKLTARVGS